MGEPFHGATPPERIDPAGPQQLLHITYARQDEGWVRCVLIPALGLTEGQYWTRAEDDLGAPLLKELERAVQSCRYTLLVASGAARVDDWAQFGGLLAQHLGIEEGKPRLLVVTRDFAPSSERARELLPLRQRCLVCHDCSDPQRAVAALAALAAQLALTATDPPLPECPYPGLRMFGADPEGFQRIDLFFGRDDEGRELIAKLRAGGRALLVGPSGCGKSSLVRARVLPALGDGAEAMAIAVTRPGTRPDAALRATLCAIDAELDAIIEAYLDACDPATALPALRAAGGPRRLVYVDQLEEVFLDDAEDSDERAWFFKRLAALARVPGVAILLGMRADFYGDLMRSPAWDDFKDHRVELAPLRGAALRQAITRPAERVGVHVEVDLVERLVREADRDRAAEALPLLQVALEQLWAHREWRYLSLASYTRIAEGERCGLDVVLAHHADAATDGLDEPRRILARRALIDLVHLGEGRPDTRRRRTTDELRRAGDDPSALDRVLDHLAARRLITLGAEAPAIATQVIALPAGGQPGIVARHVDLAHDTLITGWPMLARWIRERRDDLRTQRRLEARAVGGGLLASSELPEFTRWVAWIATPAGQALGASEALRRLVRRSVAARNRRIAGLVAFIAVLAVAAGVALWLKGIADDNAASAEQHAVAEAAAKQEAVAANGEAQRQAQQAVAANGEAQRQAQQANVERDRANLQRERANANANEADRQRRQAERAADQIRRRATLDKAADLDKRVEQLRDSRQFQEAVQVAQDVVQLREKALGSDRLEVASSLNKLGTLHYAQNAYSEAEAAWVRALQIREKSPSTPQLQRDIVESLDHLAGLYSAQRQFSKAEPLWRRALTLQEGALGASAPAVATTLDNLARLYSAQGSHNQAAPLAERALAIQEQVLGTMHPDVATSLEILAGIHRSRHEDAQAEPLLVRALDIREKALGPRHPDLMVTINHLATLYSTEGAYDKAAPLLIQALDIREKITGPIHSDVADSLNQLAVLFATSGAYAKVALSYARELEIDEAQSCASPRLADGLTVLARLYEAQGAHTKAESLLTRALKIREKMLGETHSEVFTSLDNLARFYRTHGSYAKAEPLAVRALELRKKSLGTMHPDVAQSSNDLAALYRLEGAYAKAEPLLKKALEIREKALGAMHPDVAESLNELAELYRIQGAYAKEEPLLTRARDIREAALGAAHPETARSLTSLALLYQTQGSYERAYELLHQALHVREKALGSEHPTVAYSLNNLGELNRILGNYKQAIVQLIAARRIREKAFGPMHPEVAESLDSLAVLYQAVGSYAEAEPLFQRAIEIREKALGPMHPDVATSLGNLAVLFQAQGSYAKAESLLVRALDLRERALGAAHPDVAASLSNLASLYQAQGAYAKAEPLYVRALELHEKALGPVHPDVAASLGKLAMLYQAQGSYAKAEPLLVRALELREKTLGAAHPDVAASLNNLADLYRAQGAYAQAQPRYVLALDIREKALGPNHPLVATSLNNLADLYQAQGAYAKAEPLDLRALDLFEKALGPNHPLVATSLNNLAGLYQAQGAYAKAEPLYARALDIREKSLGPNHPDVATSLNNLANLYRAQGAYTKAEPLLARAADIAEQQLRTELERLSRPRKQALMALLQGDTDSLVAFHADAIPSNVPALELALTTVLRRKGRSVDSLADSQTRLRAHLTPVLQQQLDQLSHVRSELVGHLYAPTGSPAAAAAHRDAIKTLRTRIDKLEAALSAASDEFRTQVAPVTVAAVQAKIPADAALVEFVRYRRFDPRQPRHWQEERYVAYLLTRQGPPRWVALGEAQPIDAAIDAALAAMDGRIAATTARATLRRLDAQLLAPIRGQLSGIAHLILAPDGKLNLVPFEALIDPQGRYALESDLVSYVSSGRDLLRLALPQRPRSSAVLIAGPDYGPTPRSPGTLTFSPLPGAAAEATDLQRYFPTAAITGKRATKAALAMLTGPAMLHIATHGFYGWPTSLAGAATRGSVTLGAPLPPIRDPSDGLDQAGLAMADANWGPAGIVTAREIAGFDWTGTQLVVLSACQTGVGAVASGDGVYGLRQALVLAGAASQVVSLWSVADASTPALMRDYYAALRQGIGRAEALRQAKRHMLQQPRYAHPFYWAAFIPAGDWRPLDPTAFLPQRSTP